MFEVIMIVFLYVLVCILIVMCTDNCNKFAHYTIYNNKGPFIHRKFSLKKKYIIRSVYDLLINNLLP